MITLPTRDRVLIGCLIGLFSLAIVMAGIAQFRPKTMASSGSSVQWKRRPGIGVLVINGSISYASNGRGFYVQTLDGVINQLDALKENPSVKAIIIRINSPGGTVGASQELYQAIQRFKADTARPVIVSVADVCASGAYWVALAGDTIFANPGSLVGSIGVILQQWDLTHVKERYGIHARVFKAGKHKDLLSSWRNPTSEEQVLVQNLMDNVHLQFKAHVKTNRKLSDRQLHRVTTGRVFTGEQAKKEGLIDEVGGFQEAIAHAAALTNLSPDAPLIYEQKQSVADLFDQLRLNLGSFSLQPPQILPRL